MKQKLICLSLAICTLLSGCSAANDFMEKMLFKEAGIASDSNYQAYQTYDQNGKLTPQGYYSEEVFEQEVLSEAIPADVALVSFSRNSYLNVTYYTDAECSERIDEHSCYLKSGTRIYAAVEVSKDVASSMYAFAGFRVYQFKFGGRDLIDTVDPGSDGFILEITDDMLGADFIIEPIGDYGTRIIKLRDYYTDDSGNEHNLAGTWLIDDTEVTGEEAEINPVASYIISYTYDSNEYFYLSSEPECYYSNNEDGVVIFELMEASDESLDYSVQLHEYLAAAIETSVDRTVSLNGGKHESVVAGQKFLFDKLQYGESLTVITNKEWPQLANSRDLILIAQKRSASNRYEYTLTVPYSKR